jgi:tetrahydromethanopterin S-methyltransferase subunit G
MPRITEKLEFMKGRAVKVSAKTRIGRDVGYKKRAFA